MRRPKRSPAEPVVDLVPPEVVQRCVEGDELAWKELVDLTYREVYTLCLRILIDPDDAAEATQDAYLKAWRGLKGFRGDSMFGTWLYRVATNAALSKHRSRKRRRTHETASEDESLTQVASTVSTEDSAGAKMDVARLEVALQGLPEQMRSAVVLRDVYGFSMAEIAERTGCSETAAKVRVHRGRKRLKEIMYPTEEGRDGDEV
ncbi:MAG: RNA polymerase sigma factor [Actinobacteria bacterium]|nr:RNA polymerase sigma factor [Actinomycetota bacterium]